MVRIVKLSEKHIKRMSEIEVECFKTPWSYDMLKNELENQYATYFVAVADGEPVGYIGFYKIIDEGHITNVAVTTAYRRMGIARRLIEKAIAEMKKQDIKRATLEVNHRNDAAINLYESFNFVLCGRRKQYYEGVDDALIYWLEFEGAK